MGSPEFPVECRAFRLIHRQSKTARVQQSHRIVNAVIVSVLWLTISDEGAGFDVQSVLNLEISPELMLASGLGLVMMKAFSDNLLFNAKGNEVTLVFYSERNRDVKELISERQQSRRVRGTTPHSLI